MCPRGELVSQGRAQVPKFPRQALAASFPLPPCAKGENEIFNCVHEVELSAQVRRRDCLRTLALLASPHPSAGGEGKEEVKRAAEQKVLGIRTSLCKETFICGDLLLQTQTEEGIEEIRRHEPGVQSCFSTVRSSHSLSVHLSCS